MSRANLLIVQEIISKMQTNKTPKSAKSTVEGEDFQPEAYPLVLFNSETNQFEINEECRDFLRKLEGPIGVISVAGMYRTGKSYLLNRMLLNQSRGFDVGPTINACTKGVWIWGKPIDGTTPEGDPIKVLVLDTEGLGALDEDSNHDVRIFSLAILLSSFFIYNSAGSIDENALQQLSLVINLTNHIQIKAGGIREEQDPEEYAQYFPSFMWVVRDFTLQLTDAEGDPITSKEYLEKALQSQKGFSESVMQKNRIRRLLTSFFKERDCCTMIRPLTKEEELQNLADMDLSSLRPEFVEQIQVLRRKVINKIKPKQINGRKLNGEMLFNLAQSYVDAINKGAIPSIESSWSYICKNECLKANQNAYESFERQFYEGFQQQVPMGDDELKELYTLCKKEALAYFSKNAVGDVRDEFLAGLKLKMQEKLQMLRIENEKTSEHICSMFLQQNYDPIEKNLRNQQYAELENLKSDIEDFQYYFLDQGPKGPFRKEICLEFCLKCLSEGAEYFNKGISNELYLQQQIAGQTQKKLRSELQDVKQEFQSENKSLESKVRQLDVEKAELSAKEQSTREHLQMIMKDKERLEQDADLKLQNLKKESDRAVDDMRQKMSLQDESHKEVSRRQMQADSEFDKQKALFEQQIEFITERNQALEAREKELMTELKSQKVDTTSQKSEYIKKFEAQLQELQKKLEEQTDVIYEMESKASQADQDLSETQQKFQELETHLRKDLQKSKDSQTLLQKQNDELKAKFDCEITEFTQQKESECIEQADRIEEMEQLIKELEEENDTLKSKFEKDQAINHQKLEFLQVQLDQERNQRQEEKKNHDRMLRSIQSSQRESVIGKEEATKQLDDLKAQFQQECTNLQASFDSQISTKEKEICQLSENCQKLELEIQLRDADFRKENEVLRENLRQAEQDRDKLRETCKGLELHKARFVDDLNSRHQEQLLELEQELEEKVRLHESQLQEINSQSEEQLTQLKSFYEAEKQRLEQRFHDEKDRNTKRMSELIGDHEQKIRDESNNHEDEMEMVQSELQHSIQEKEQIISHFENQVSLREQRIEELERYLTETKESLDRMQQSHSLQVDQLAEKLNKERKELTDKVDALTAEITRKERLCTTFENQKEALTLQVQGKDKQIAGAREEALKERSDLQSRFTELKIKFEEKEDELTQKKIDYERQSALNQQQILFTEQKANDLNSQLDRTVQRYEDRIKMDREELQREIREKSQRLQAEKENADAKFDVKRKQAKELEAKLQKQTADAEREKAVLNLKTQNLESQYENSIKSQETQIVRLREQNQHLQDTIASDQQAVGQQLDLARKECAEMDRQLQDTINNYDKDKALWEGRFAFLEQQRDQSKKDLEEASQKFQTTVDQLQKVQSDSKNKIDSSHNNMMQQMQQQLSQRLKDAQEANQNSNYELNQKIKQLEREKAVLAEKLELASRDQISEQGNLVKKVEKLQDSIERLQTELDSVKKERDLKMAELVQKMEKEREVFNQKKRELESKGSKTESKQTELLLNHERERAKWDQHLTDMIHQRDDFKSENDRLKMKVDSYFKEIEKLKLDVKNQRKNQFSSYQAQQTGSNYASTVGQGIAAKFNIPARTSGYTPGMYASTRAQDSNAEKQPETERGFNTRYGQNQAGVKEVNQSMEFSKMGTGFLSQSMAMGKGKGLISLAQGESGNNLGEMVNEDDAMESFTHDNNNLLSTPSSKNDESELVHKGSDDE